MMSFKAMMAETVQDNVVPMGMVIGRKLTPTAYQEVTGLKYVHAALQHMCTRNTEPVKLFSPHSLHPSFTELSHHLKQVSCGELISVKCYRVIDFRCALQMYDRSKEKGMESGGPEDTRGSLLVRPTSNLAVTFWVSVQRTFCFHPALLRASGCSTADAL